MQIHIFTDNDEKIEQNSNHRNNIIWISLYNILTGFSIISSSYALRHPRLFLRKSSTSVVYISHNLRKCYFNSKFKVDNCPASLSTWAANSSGDSKIQLSTQNVIPRHRTAAFKYEAPYYQTRFCSPFKGSCKTFRVKLAGGTKILDLVASAALTRIIHTAYLLYRACTATTINDVDNGESLSRFDIYNGVMPRLVGCLRKSQEPSCPDVHMCTPYLQARIFQLAFSPRRSSGDTCCQIFQECPLRPVSLQA